jgi:hypothetical protein
VDAGGAEVAAAAEVAGAEVAAEAVASPGELAAGARADRFSITLKTKPSWPGPIKSTRPIHVFFPWQLAYQTVRVAAEQTRRVLNKSRRNGEENSNAVRKRTSGCLAKRAC